MIIYLLHFHRPLHHARHYLGIATDLGARLEEHARGTGARIMAVLKETRDRVDARPDLVRDAEG